MSIKGKIALVTGAAKGIGKTIALELAHQGAIIAGVDYSKDTAEMISTYLKELNLPGQGFAMDVTNPEMIASGMEKITATFGAPQILINNAGITRDNLLMRMSEEEWAQVINTNMTSVFRMSRACMRDMLKARWGRIVNIVSIVAYIGNPGQANYAASKAGIVGLSKSLAQEIASRNITVNCVAPGFIDTDMTKKLSEAQREALYALIPMKKIGKPEDVAKAVAFLVSDAAEYITGSTIHVNGGMFMD